MRLYYLRGIQLFDDLVWNLLRISSKNTEKILHIFANYIYIDQYNSRKFPNRQKWNWIPQFNVRTNFARTAMNHGSFKQFVSNLRFQFHRETGECTILRANLNQVRGKCLINEIKVWLRSGNVCIEKKRFNNLFYLINYFLSIIRCSFHRNFNNRDIVSLRMRKRKMLKLLKLFSDLPILVTMISYFSL